MQLPSPLPDETLFSRYVRHMTILGMTECDYLKALLNKPRASIHPYLTVGITKAASICKDSIFKIYQEQTLGSFFSYFLPQHAQSISNALLRNNGTAAIRASQLVTFKESELLSLKYCPVCANNDIRQFGVTYWHRVHQIPGIEACSEHKVWLMHQGLPARPHIKPLLLPKCSEKFEECQEMSFKLAKFTKNYIHHISLSNEFFSLPNLLERLKDLGYMCGETRFKRQQLTSDFFHFAMGLKRTSTGLLPVSEQDYRYLSYLLSGSVCQHPFKYLLILFWLNNKLPDFDKYQISTTEEKPINKDKSKLCLSLLKQGKSMAKVSEITGKSRCYLKALAIKNNVAISLRPRLINKKVIKAVISMAYKGFHRQKIANELRISTGSVEQIISSEEGLVVRRRQYKYQSKRRCYKATVLRAMQMNHSATREQIKKSCYSAFYWLYANERDWLNQTLPKPTKPKLPPKVDWKKRDLELAPQVKGILTNCDGKISRTHIDRMLGGHGWLTRKLHKLPLTMLELQKLNKP
ncbi:TnsD family Tn7-like transposition protein [Idiomarina sp.]|uniref:TnsD family Tn7-like transposition protein n=1 Tax=Idiomarina sp. TaxID=1874361 RepID=UPI003A8F7CCF